MKSILHKYLINITKVLLLVWMQMSTHLANVSDGTIIVVASLLWLFAALKPGEVQNLRSTLNPIEASLTLNWDQPINTTTAGDVTAYDIRFIISGNGGGNNYYSIMTVNAPARSIHLTRESGLKPLTKYTIEVRARNFHCQGEWSCISEYIGTYSSY